jgi:ParB family transcriptional regulator, chromosome partitioning protein
MALAVVDDHERQERVWSELPQARRSAEALRTALTQDEVPMSDPVARFVTRKAYEHAGGAVRRDLFADESDVYLVDRALLERLAQDKLEKRATSAKRHCASGDGISRPPCVCKAWLPMRQNEQYEG